MKNVLVVDCCIRRQGRTRELMESFIAALPEHCRVTRLRLEEENLSCRPGRARLIAVRPPASGGYPDCDASFFCQSCQPVLIL